MDTYRKEARLTLGFFVLYLLVAHTAPWALILGTNNAVRIFGFPLHYFMAVFLGWFGVLAVSIWWNIAADRLDEEIAASGAGDAMPAAMTGSAPMSSAPMSSAPMSSAPMTEGDRS